MISAYIASLKANLGTYSSDGLMPPEGPAKGGQHVAGMDQVEQVHQGGVLTLDQLDVQVAHESAHGQPEVIPDQDNALDAAAVALPQGLHQLRVALVADARGPLGME